MSLNTAGYNPGESGSPAVGYLEQGRAHRV